MTVGAAASITVVFTGLTASPFFGEIDLASDAPGDTLAIDAAGDALIAVGATTFTGVSAAAAALDRSVTLEGEGWEALGTESGQATVTEGR